MSKHKFTGDRSDMAHQIKTADKTVKRCQCICDPMDYAALGHMTNCDCYEEKPRGR